MTHKIEKAYEFEEGKSYWIAVDTDDKEEIQKVRVELLKANPKIIFIVVSKGAIEPVVNPDKK